MNRVDGKIAVVTGGTQGLGAAVALRLMTGSVINFDQSVWGAYQFAPPTPQGKLAL